MVIVKNAVSDVLSAKDVAARKAKCEEKGLCYISLKPFEGESDVATVHGFKVRKIYSYAK